jgi:two-component system, NarL family, response regulator NreC
MTADLIRVVLADDHAVVRAGLQAVLKTAKDMEVVGQATTAEEAVALVDRFHPDVVVMDLSMNGAMAGLTATREVVARKNGTRVLVLTMHSEKEYLVPLLEAGASGYLVKSAADRELVDAIRTVASGDVYVSPTAARVLARGLTTKDPQQEDRDRFGRLTEREQDVLRFTAQGYSAPEIGRKLSISPKTVDTYKQRINEKLGISHRAEYVQLALRLGLLAAA